MTLAGGHQRRPVSVQRGCMSSPRPRQDSQGSVREPLSDDALETSKLLVELLQEGSWGRRGHARGVTAGSLSPHAIRAAIHVHQHGAVTIGQLGDGLGISQGWASRLVEDMVRSGHLERERDPDDRRVYRVRLSPMAVESVESAYRWRGDAVEAALRGLSAKQRAGIQVFLRRFLDGIASDD